MALGNKNTREKILNGCLRLFLHKNLGAVTIDDLVLHSGCTRKTIYYHFKDKNEIFIAVTELFVQNLLDYFEKFNSEERHSFLDYIFAYIDNLQSLNQNVKTITNNKASSYLYFMIQASEYYPNFNEKYIELYEPEQRSWEKNLRAAIERKEIRPDIDITTIATKFHSISTGIEVQSLLLHTGTSFRTLQLLMTNLYKKINIQSDISNIPFCK